MGQIYHLILAKELLASNAITLGVSPEQLAQIKVSVYVEVSQLPQPCLWLSYDITFPSLTLGAQLQWPHWSAHNVQFTDYLWEQTCLECFLATDDQSYVEVNANPNGQYAIYSFENYRTPSTLPPTPLLQSHSTQRAFLNWDNERRFGTDSHDFQRTIGIPLAQLPFDVTSAHSAVLLHPCVILYFGSTPLYFASAHPSPADFHLRHYWPTYPQSSLSNT